MNSLRSSNDVLIDWTARLSSSSSFAHRVIYILDTLSEYIFTVLRSHSASCCIAGAHSRVVEMTASAAENVFSGLVSSSATTIGLSTELLALRFTGLQIPPNATITSAVVVFPASNQVTFPSAPLRINIAAESQPSPSLDDTSFGISSRMMLATNVAWSISTWGSGVHADITPNLAPLLNKLLQLPSWSTSASLLLRLHVANGAAVSNTSK